MSKMRNIKLTDSDCTFVHYVLRMYARQTDVILETLKEQVEWSIADYDLNGDDYYNLRDYTVYQTVIKLLEQVDLVDVDNYKQNTIISG